MKGHKNVMAGIVNNDLLYTPFIDTIKKQKPIHDDLLRMVHILSI
jgi:6-phosphofructokinase 1